MKLGIIPTLNDLIPTQLSTMMGLMGSSVGSLAALTYATGNDSSAVLGTLGLLGLGWLAHRFDTKEQRNGYLLDAPYTYVAPKAVATTNANLELTSFLRNKGAIDDDSLITETRSEQYRIIKIPNYDPDRVEAKLSALSMKLGIKREEMLFVPMYEAGCSAVLVHLPPEQWLPVPYDYNQLTQGELIGYLGKDIYGNAIRYAVRYAYHILIAGKSGSGKTEIMCNDMESMRSSGLPVEIYIVDPKDTAQLKRQKSTYYTRDIEAGISKLTQLLAICEERLSKYSDAGCDNWFEYQAKVDPTEPALFFYIDEVTEYLMEDLEEDLEAGEHKRHKRAKQALQLAIQKQRASGLFMRLGMQHPEAKTLSTTIRNNITARIVCAVEDHHASGVAGVKGAECLPMEGGFIFKYQNKTILGRAAYLKAGVSQ